MSDLRKWHELEAGAPGAPGVQQTSELPNTLATCLVMAFFETLEVVFKTNMIYMVT